MKNMKRKLLKRIITISLSASVLLTACGRGADFAGPKSQTDVSEDMSIPAWERYASEPITLDWYINYSWFVTKWGGNLVSDAITEETGVSVNFIAPIGSEEEKLNALISSDSLPDIITLGWWENQVKEMVDKDMVYALNELADQYDMYFYDVTDPIVKEWYTLEDGNIYYYPCSSYTPKDVEENDCVSSNQTFLVRKDIYEAIGSPDMSTQEGFEAAVKAAKEYCPEVNGEPLIPIGAHVFDEFGCCSFDKYLMNFLAVPYEKDGEVYDRYTDSEYISWLKLFRRLGQEGYLADDIFVDSRTQMNEKLAEGRYFCMIYQHTDMADQEKLLYQQDPEKIYIAVEGPRNSMGDDPTLPTSGINGWTVTLVSKNCKDPKRAIAFIDYLISERGQKMVSIGVEGETYDIVDGKCVIKPEVLELLNSDREAYNAKYGADDTYWMLQNNVMQLEWYNTYEEPMKQLVEWTYPYAQYLGQYEFSITSDSAIGDAHSRINTLWSNTLPQLLLAQSDEEFDSILSNFVAERQDLGYEVVLAEQTRQMNENKRKLGI